VSYFRQPLSPLLWNFIKGLLSTYSDPSACRHLIERALKYTCHVARVRSVAYAAGRCAYYARMIEKMGVFETVSGSISGKGRILHKLLALAAEDLFRDHTLSDLLRNSSNLISQAITHSAEVLRVDVGENVLSEAADMMKKLLKALHRAQARGVITSNPNIRLFPVVEQEFIDFDDHMYGAPDLILEVESSAERKALVIEWKSYEVGESAWSDVDLAQVVAYAIMEARRLGIKGLSGISKAILGIDVKMARKIDELMNCVKNSQNKADLRVQEELRKIIQRVLDNSRKELKVLPIVISSKSESFPPHPLMYKLGNHVEHARRFSKLYNIVRKVIVAAEHLTLQLTNVESLLAEARGQEFVEIRERLKACCSSAGYLAFNYTPCRVLSCGRPAEQRSWPCRTRKGKLLCPFAGDHDACKFYFGRREREEFESLMWRLRYKVFEDKERSLINYKAMYILLKEHGLQWLFDDSIKSTCKGFKVDIAGATAHIEHKNSAIFYVRTSRGRKELGKFRFDVAELNDAIVEDEEESLVVKRKLRSIEREKGIIGTVKKSVAAYIVSPHLPSPLLTINTFLMVRDCDVEGDDVIYYLYSPSPVLYHNLRLFKHYIKALRGTDTLTRLLLFEAPANLTLMELRAIDALHRYIALAAEMSSEEIKRQELVTEVQPEEISREIKVIKPEIDLSYKEKCEFERGIPLYDILRKLLKGNVGVKE